MSIDLGIMIASHNAFRRDLTKLARTAKRPNLSDPVQQLAVANGWATFKRQLLQHHQGEDAELWPALTQRLSADPDAMSTLADMEAEHNKIDPLLAAVDHAFADPNLDLGDVIDELHATLSHHLGHEERDSLPLIDQVLTEPEWARLLEAIRARGSVEAAMEMVPWILDDLNSHEVATVLQSFPPLVKQVYADQWKPAYEAVARW